MKKYRMLIACVIALLVIAAAYFAIVLLVPEETVEQGENAPVYTLVGYGTTEIDRIDITHADGYSYAILGTNVKNSAGAYSRKYVIEGKSHYTYKSSEIGSAVMAMGNITVNAITDENPVSLATYGFDAPTSVVTVTPYEDYGAPVTVILGDPTPVGSGHYAMVDGKPEVYVLTSHTTRYMLARDTQYRDLTVISYTDPSTEIKALNVTENGKAVLGVREKTEEEIKASNDPYEPIYRITAPVDMDASKNSVKDLFSALAEISALSIVEDGTANSDKYGLNANTTVIEVENADGTTKKFTLSQVDQSGYRYGIVSGIDSILLFNGSDFNFINTDYKTLLYKGLWLHKIEDVSRVEMDFAGEKHTLDFTFSESEQETAVEGVEVPLTLHAKLDGKEISENNGRLLYGKVLSPMFYDFSEGMEKGAYEYKFKIIYADGREFTMDFARLNGRQYAAIRDGEDTGFFVNVTDLTAIKDAVAKVLDGNELTMAE